MNETKGRIDAWCLRIDGKPASAKTMRKKPFSEAASEAWWREGSTFRDCRSNRAISLLAAYVDISGDEFPMTGIELADGYLRPDRTVMRSMDRSGYVRMENGIFHLTTRGHELIGSYLSQAWPEKPPKREVGHATGNLPEQNSSRNTLRLPTSELERVTAEHVWRAIADIMRDGPPRHFGPSTDYDLIADDGSRLPPKAVFGRAASIALGYSVGPYHFSAGVGTPCFRILEQAGYSVVRKSFEFEATGNLTTGDLAWAEGRKRLVSHVMRERGRGLARAKKSAFLREHGRLFCERCQMDPVLAFGEQAGEACIEVHHREMAVAAMPEHHVTRLEDLQCVCANCHRYIHRLMKIQEAGASDQGRFAGVRGAPRS